MRGGVISGRVFVKSSSESHRLGSPRTQFTEERITTSDYNCRLMELASWNSIITHLLKQGEEEDEQLSRLPLCYWALLDLTDASQDFGDYCPEDCEVLSAYSSKHTTKTHTHKDAFLKIYCRYFFRKIFINSLSTFNKLFCFCTHPDLVCLFFFLNGLWLCV